MVEYHGWLNIKLNESLSKTETLNEYNKIKNIIPKGIEKSRIVSLKFVNGHLLLHLGGVANNWKREVDLVISSFDKINKKYNGTYGLLYIWDNDSLVESKSNLFEVYQFSKSNKKVNQDKFLSPCVPKIIDEW